MKHDRLGKRSITAVFTAALVAAAIVVILGVSYVVIVLPGSLGTSPTTYSSTSTTLSINSGEGCAYVTCAIKNATISIPVGAAINPDFNFDPNSVTVSISAGNNTVIWVNLDSSVQEVVGPNGLFNLTLPGASPFFVASAKYVFTTPGTYVYTDPYYSWLNGTVTVVS